VEPGWIILRSSVCCSVVSSIDWVQAVDAREQGLPEHVPGYGREHGGTVEGAVERAAVQVQRVKREDVVMRDAVVPGRAGAVVTEVFPAHLRVSREPVGVAVDAAAGAVEAGFGILAPGGHARAVRSGLDPIGGRRNVDQHPVEEVYPRQFGRNGSAFLIHIGSFARDVRIATDQHERTGTGGRSAPPKLGVEVVGEGDVVVPVRFAEGVPLGNSVAVTETRAGQVHDRSPPPWVALEDLGQGLYRSVRPSRGSPLAQARTPGRQRL